MSAGCPRLMAGEVELYFYGELAGAARASLAAHLLTCPACREACDELRVIRQVLAARPAVEGPEGGDWTGFMAGLERRVRPAAAPAPGGRGRLVTYLAMAALVTFVTASVAMLSRLGTPSVPAPVPAVSVDATVTPSAPASSASAAGVPDRGGAVAAAGGDVAFATLSEQHFARSKLVVLGLATKDADAKEHDWHYERELATSLLPETRLYRRAAQDRGMTALAGVMSDLELVLLQTSLADDRDAGTLPQLQRLIRKRDLVAKIQVAEAAF
jgi:Putative zinc-finger